MPVAGVQVGENGGLQEKGGLRLRSDRPVTVAQIQSDDVNRDAQSSGGTMLLPVNVLGTHYMVMTYPQKQTPEIASLTGSPSGAGRLLIVGTQPETMVTLKLSPTSSGVVFGTLPGLPAGEGYTTFPLGDGEVFQVLSGNPGDDLSGTEIITSQPGRRVLRQHDDDLRADGRQPSFTGHGTRADAAGLRLEPQLRGRGIAAATGRLRHVAGPVGRVSLAVGGGERPTLTGRHRRSVGIDFFRRTRARGGDAADPGRGLRTSRRRNPC